MICFVPPIQIFRRMKKIFAVCHKWLLFLLFLFIICDKMSCKSILVSWYLCQNIVKSILKCIFCCHGRSLINTCGKLICCIFNYLFFELSDTRIWFASTSCVRLTSNYYHFNGYFERTNRKNEEYYVINRRLVFS